MTSPLTKTTDDVAGGEDDHRDGNTTTATPRDTNFPTTRSASTQSAAPAEAILVPDGGHDNADDTKDPSDGLDRSAEDVPNNIDPMLVAYRHDINKFRGRSNEEAADKVAGVRVNDPVPRGADADAALLSRPRSDPEQTNDIHESPYRLSLRTGNTVVADRLPDGEIEARIRRLVRIDEPMAAHKAWLQSDVAAVFSESVYYPYTSLKYHVILSGSLLGNYLSGESFDELWLVAEAGDTARPFRTVLTTDRVSLLLTPDPAGRPAAPLGPAPARSFADVWARLSDRPPGIDPDDQLAWQVLDAQLRRIRSWSAALQYIEDYIRAHDERIGPTERDAKPVDTKGDLPGLGSSLGPGLRPDLGPDPYPDGGTESDSDRQ